MPVVDFNGRQLEYPFSVSGGDARTTAQGAAPATLKSRTSLIFTNTLAAGERLPFPVVGFSFYVLAATGDIGIRPDTGAENIYSAGTGLSLGIENSFNILQIRNPGIVPVVFQIFAGFDQYIDRRLYLVNSSQPTVVRPTYPTASAASIVDINDISGTSFNDLSGQKWFALNRVSFLISNIDSGVTLLVQKAGSVVSNGPAIAAVFPLTSFILNTSGNYRLSNGGGPVNAVVSETYQSLKG